MFGLIRLVILCAVAFVAGVFYERQNVSTTCEAVGGQKSGGLCVVR